jgi:hypothetical protein
MNSEKHIKQRNFSFSIKKIIPITATLCILSIIFFPKSRDFLLRNVLHILISLNIEANYETYDE